MSKLAGAVATWNGGVWSEHPDYSSADWRAAVANGDTRNSYWDWCVSQIEMAQKSPASA